MTTHAVRRILRLFGFVTAPVLAAVSPLVVLPSITSTHGADAWGVVAVALSIGGAAAVLAELGWGVVGPQRVGRDPEGARMLYASSLATRLMATAILLPLVVVVVALLVPGDRSAAVLVAAGVLLSALSPAWYLIGLGRPWTVIVVDVLPRCTAAIVAAAVIGNGAPLWVYGAALVSAAVLSFIATGCLRGTVAWPSRRDWATVPAAVRGQATLVVARGVSTAYTALPATLVAVVVPGAVPVFAAADRLVRMGLSVAAAVPSTLQRWIGHTETIERQRRAHQAVLFNTGLGVASGTLVLVLLPVASHIVFSGTISLPFPLVAANAFLAALVCTSRGLGLALVAHDRASSITIAVVVAATIGTTGVITGAAVLGAVGAVAGLCVAEAVGLGLQLIALHRPLDRSSRAVTA